MWGSAHSCLASLDHCDKCYDKTMTWRGNQNCSKAWLSRILNVRVLTRVWSLVMLLRVCAQLRYRYISRTLQYCNRRDVFSVKHSKFDYFYDGRSMTFNVFINCIQWNPVFRAVHLITTKSVKQWEWTPITLHKLKSHGIIAISSSQ